MSGPYDASAVLMGRQSFLGRGRVRLWHLGTAVLVVAVLLAVAAPWIAPYSPAEQQLDAIGQPPSARHWFGTDPLGRDVFSRMLYALRTDLALVVPAAAIPMVLGGLLGGAAAYFGGFFDTALRWVLDVFQGLPAYVLLIALVAAFGRGVGSLILAFTLLGWIVYARIARTEARRIREENFVLAAYLSGSSRLTVFFRHVVPNGMAQPLAFLVTDMGMALQMIAALSFFGLGVPEGTPELGAMIADAQLYMQTNLWLGVFPGAAILLLGLSMAVVGDALRGRQS